VDGFGNYYPVSFLIHNSCVSWMRLGFILNGFVNSWDSGVSIIPMQLKKILCFDLLSWSLMYNACMQNYRMCDCRNSQHMKNHWTCDLLKKSQLVDHGLSLPYLIFMGLLFSRDGERRSLCNKRHHLPDMRVNIQREIAHEKYRYIASKRGWHRSNRVRIKVPWFGVEKMLIKWFPA